MQASPNVKDTGMNVADDSLRTPTSLVIFFAFLYSLALIFGLLVNR